MIRVTARMRRRQLLAMAGATALGSAQFAAAQGVPSKVYRVGTLSVGAPTVPGSANWPPLIKGFTDRGYVLDQNLIIIARGAELHPDRLPRLLDELVASKADVIIAIGYGATLVAKQNATLPVVSFSAGDPVATGLVDSLARPGGHVTGISDVSVEITPKRLEFMTEMAPALRRVAVLYNAADAGMTLRYRAFEAGAKAKGIGVEAIGVREPDDFGDAFTAMNGDVPDAIMMVSDPLTNLNRRRVFDYAVAHRLPAIYEFEMYVRDGGLMSYGPDFGESFGRVTALVDRILKGAKPADLPFEQPTLFRLVINLEAAKAIGLTVPPILLARADEVIE